MFGASPSGMNVAENVVDLRAPRVVVPTLARAASRMLLRPSYRETATHSVVTVFVYGFLTVPATTYWPLPFSPFVVVVGVGAPIRRVVGVALTV